MAFKEYTVDIEHIAGQDTLVSVNVNGTVYTAPSPFVMSAANAGAILTWLNATIPFYLWLSEYSTNDDGLSYLNIYTGCTSDATAHSIIFNIVFSEVDKAIVAVVTDCAEHICSGITATPKAALEIDCVNQCLNFSDITGVYSTGNTQGYGAPNFPALANIASITFTLLDQGGSTLGSPYTSTYRPTDPFNSICLTAANFGYTGFVGNTVYQLKYTMVTSGTVITCALFQIPFRMPCCGSVLTNGLRPSFVLYQQNGGTNPTPTPNSWTLNDTTLAYSTDNPGGYGSGKYVSSIAVTNHGASYLVGSPPNVVITGGGGSGATATAVLDTRAISTGVALDLNGQGSGYTSSPTVTISGGGGTGATAVAVITSGQVTAVIVTNAGSGYTTTPSASITGGGGTGASVNVFLVQPVLSITVTANGSGYTSVPTVTIDAPPYPGITATATAVLTGSDNPQYSDVSHTEFVVTHPDGEVIAFDIGYVPNALNTVALITNENLGYGDGPISDGVYKIVFNVYATPASSECLLGQVTIYTLMFQNTYNCLYNQGISLLSGCDIAAKQQNAMDWYEMRNIIDASKNNINCVVGKIERLLARCKLNCPTC